MKRLCVLVSVLTLVVAGCGGAEPAASAPVDRTVVTPEAPGELAINTIRIGDQVWARTLPMTRGQCVIGEETASLPAQTFIWGTLDGNDEINFNVTMNKDGDVSLLIDDQRSLYWTANTQVEGDIVEITHDYENLIARGQGVFENVFTGEQAEGSFVLQCEPAES